MIRKCGEEGHEIRKRPGRHGLPVKLVQCRGENNVLWSTDSIWHGSPQDQIQAFRAFQLAPELRDKHGYPQMTPVLRAKVFGLNALRVPDPTFLTHGPRTRREFLNLKAWG